ncbi:60Kd inner membrane protein-domain-containing protein [Blastocladiella britannica]|nr:60Kd inner membrane protein-domain-containing protein [Blastocladiella britannica]
MLRAALLSRPLVLRATTTQVLLASRPALTLTRPRWASSAPVAAAAPVLSTTTTPTEAVNTVISGATPTDVAMPDVSSVSEFIAQSAHAIGDLKAMGLASSWTPVGWIQQGLEALHVAGGLPWWASIIACTLVLRAGLTPLFIKLQRNSAKMANLRPETERIMAEMNAAKATQDTAALHRATGQMQQLYAKHDINPLKLVAMPMIQAPIMISFFMAIRKMGEAGVPGLKDGGMLWFPDLTLADPTYALPIIASAGFLATIEMNAETGVSNPQTEKYLSIFRIVTIAAIPITAAMPAGVFVYWITSTAYTLGQALALKNASVRAYFNVPPLIKHAPPPTPPGGVPKEMGFIEGFRTAFKAGREENERQLKETAAREVAAAAAGKKKQ